MLVWTDLETTGLDPKKDFILEVAVVVTDDNLVELGHYTSLVLDECRNPQLFVSMMSGRPSRLDRGARPGGVDQVGAPR